MGKRLKKERAMPFPFCFSILINFSAKKISTVLASASRSVLIKKPLPQYFQKRCSGPHPNQRFVPAPTSVWSPPLRWSYRIPESLLFLTPDARSDKWKNRCAHISIDCRQPRRFRAPPGFAAEKPNPAG